MKQKTSTIPDASISIPEVAALVRRFREIGATAMRDLPLYNHTIEVEAVGFQPFQDGWIGVLITPWFMNLMRLPGQHEPMDATAVGRKMKVELPCGERELMQGGDEAVGAYASLSLHSPMFAFKTQAAARQEAGRRLEDLLRPSEVPLPEEGGRLRTEPKRMSRRAFLGRVTADT